MSDGSYADPIRPYDKSAIRLKPQKHRGSLETWFTKGNDMDKITQSVHEIYDNRERYIIIGLTGRTGSGCSTAASILEKPISELKLAKPKSIIDNANEERKFAIIKRFIKNNWSSFVWFKIKDIITSFILEVDKTEFAEYISKYIEMENGGDSDNIKSDFLTSLGLELIRK